MEYVQVFCKCGHSSVISLSRWLHRDELLRRLRCSVCGRRPTDLTAFVPGRLQGSSREAQEAHYAALPIFDVDQPARKK